MKGEYKGFKFRVNDSFKFECAEVREHRPFDSYKELTEAIDKKEKEREAMNRKKLNLPVIDAKGVKRFLTGIHAGHSNITCKPPFDSYGEREIYPRVDWIEAAIAEMLQLMEQASIIDRILDKFKVEKERGRVDAEDHAEAVAALEKCYEQKMEAAKKTTLAEERKNPPQKRSIRI